jgi:glutamyl-tRNA synthetase
MSEVRVRFAPSPTGYLHIGGARTALFNWLWARKTGGKFILRIEDTDLARNTPESVQAIFDSMRWLGLDWDEGPDVGGPDGPYFQTQRLAIYRDHAERLIRTGHAYRCYCTKEDLAAARAAHEATGSRQAFRYPGTCRKRTDQPDAPYVVRFRAPTSGSTGWVDLVKGRIDVPNDAQQDFILLRNDGVPLYNFGAVVDDVTMRINLVARGDDHVVNTPPQILIYQALGYAVPSFAHLPMILAPNGEKLSKRHAAVSALEYAELGYLPDAVLNYLARLGWSHGDQEIFTREELIAHFDWSRCGHTPGKYDAKKFAYVESEHLRAQDDATLARLALPFLAKRGLTVAADDARLPAAIATVKTRAQTLADIAEMVDFFFREEPVLDPKAKEKFLVPASAPRLEALAKVVAGTAPFERGALEAKVGAWLAAEGLQIKDVAQAARVALTGRTQSPGLYELMEVLGEARTVARLAQGRARSLGDA